MDIQARIKNPAYNKWLCAVCMLIGNQAVLANMCPEPGNIITSNPDPSGMVTYMSPGWHSDLDELYDLNVTSFYGLFIDNSGVKCVYDRTSGFLNLYPNINPGISPNQFLNNSDWHCSIVPDPQYPDYTGYLCVCNESTTTCKF